VPAANPATLTIIVSGVVFVKAPDAGDSISHVALSKAIQFTCVVVETDRLAVWLGGLDP
jgi:hypothetical protein